MRMGIDTVRVWKAIDRNFLRSGAFRFELYDKETDSVSFSSIKLKDRDLKERLDKRYWLYTTRYKRGQDFDLVVIIPSLSRAVDKGFIGEVGYEDLKAVLSEVESEYMRHRGGDWRLGRVDFKVDIQGSAEWVVDYQNELRDWYILPRWRKFLHSRPRDIRDGKASTVYYQVSDRRFEAYNKGFQILQVYGARLLEDYLRLEYAYFSANSLSKIGFRTLEDLQGVNVASVIWDRYKRLKMAGGEYKSGEFVDLVVSEYHKQKKLKKRVRVNIYKLLTILRGGEFIDVLDRNWLMSALVSKGVEYRWAWRLCKRIEDLQMEIMRYEHKSERPVLVKQVGELLENAV